jgi:dTDP-4-amino-4,6-dideoxygalactose transaminase
VIDTSQFILRKAVTDFESAFARSHGVKHCVAVGSGTDAMHLCLWALNVGPGDAVVTTPFTFIATVEAVTLLGARPVFVDIEPESHNMDPAALEKLLASSAAGAIKAIMPVHLYGHPARISEIAATAARFRIPVVEDACQSHLARLRGTFVGNFGAAAGFSFYPGKNLGAFGEAGAVVTNDDELARKLRLLRDHGQVAKYRHAFSGHNYRMDGLQGAVLGVKLNHLPAWTSRRRAIASRYRRELAGIAGLSLPVEREGAEPVYHLFVVRTTKRDELQHHLADQGIATSIAYPIPLHLQEACAYLGHREGDFPVSERAAREVLSLPVYPELSDEQVAYVIDKVRGFFTR